MNLYKNSEEHSLGHAVHDIIGYNGPQQGENYMNKSRIRKNVPFRDKLTIFFIQEKDPSFLNVSISAFC